MTKSLYLTAIGVIGTMTGLASSASARSISASAGNALPFANQTCWSQWYTTVANVCPSMQTIEFPLVVDSAGNKTVKITAFGAGAANNVGCGAFALDANVTTLFQSGYRYLSSFGAPVVISLSGAYVPPAGFLFGQCQVNNGGRIHSLDYNP